MAKFRHIWSHSWRRLLFFAQSTKRIGPSCILLSQNFISRAQQCDQIGLFVKGLDDNFPRKSSRKMCWFLGYFEKCPYLSKNCSGYFLGNFWQTIGLFFMPTFGHTGGRILLGCSFTLAPQNWHTLISLSLSFLSLYEMHNRNSLSSSLSLNLPFSVPNSNTVYMKRAQMIVFHSHSIIHLMGLVPKVSLSPSLLPSLPHTHAYVVFHSMELFRRRNVLMAC